MRKLILIFLSTFLLITPFDGMAITPKKPFNIKAKKAYKVSITEKEVVRLVNVERKKHGLKPLVMDTTVCKVAREKSIDMKLKKYFSHQSPKYGQPTNMLKAFKVPFKMAGENIAGGSKTANEVVARWMKSPGHRANILNPHYSHIGVGRSIGGPWGYYWTQIFIKK